jgi:hypothetical protein
MSKPAFTRYVEGVPVKDRTPKLAARRGRMKLNGRSLKTLLTERAAKAQRQRTPQKGTPSHE